MRLNETKIDSFKLFVPLDKCSLSNYEKYTTSLVNNDSGEILTEYAPKIYHESNGIKTTIAIDTKPYGRALTVKGLSIGINSKMLGSSYLDGINRDNIKDIWSYLHSINADLDLPLKSMLLGRASDVDFCTDNNLLIDDDFKLISNELLILCQQLGIQSYEAKKGQFYIHHRDTARINTPFAKIYRKGFEYIGSVHQKLYYPNTQVVADVTRCEVTLKNQQFLVKYSDGGIQNSTFSSVIGGDYSKVVSNVFQTYFSKANKVIAPRTIISSDKLKGFDLMFFGIIKKHLDTNQDYKKEDLISDVFELTTYSVPKTDFRTRKARRKKIETIFETYFEGKTQKQIENFVIYLKNIGLLN